jgi:5'-nucleotidase
MKTTTLLLLSGIALACVAAPRSTAEDGRWPQRVLLTNDNGIDDLAIAELARALSGAGIEVVVVASLTDRSGASNHMTATREGRYRVQRRDWGPDIDAYGLDGEPADCVVFGLSGPMQERAPDLVVSGINGGANLGDDWFGSGTIGAARTAAYLGVPAVAISGVEDDDPSALAAVTSWAVRFVQSELVRSLRAPEYLTVSLPETSPERILGVRLAERARGLLEGRAEPAGQSEDAETWSLRMGAALDRAGPHTDVHAVEEGYIAIVPMRVDESDRDLRDRLTGLWESVPPWEPSPPANLAASPEPACDRGLGISLDEAEDNEGRAWGARIMEVATPSRAENLGLQAGDVITALNGAELTDRDPDERFADRYRALSCGDSVRIRLMRNGAALDIAFVMGR